MKISVFSLSELSPGKVNVKDSRLDQLHALTKSKKKTYLQVELVEEGAFADADAIIALEENRQDLILKDLEFLETRLGRTADEGEKNLLLKLQGILEKENFIFNAGLSEEEKHKISGYGLITNKPVVLAKREELENQDAFVNRAILESGYIIFLTGGEREARAWLIKKGATAWEAAGQVHSDIQRGFIRAEIISFNDFIAAGGETQAKQAGKLRLEQKDYIMQDADVVNFRFNKG